MRSKFIQIYYYLLVPFLLIYISSFGQTNGSGIEVSKVKTGAGFISGYESPDDNSIKIFKGIPYARPPIGELRWKAPQEVPQWDGIKECVEFGPSPMQPTPAPFSMWSEEFLIAKEPIGEDCLYLNIWTTSTEEKKPVMVWIYGGGFSSGGANVPIYDGEAMAKKGIVFVSFNYRVGIFGFFAHPELTKESPDHSSGNYGLMDQIAALQWVQKNIGAFGGDPDNVTIAGQSAGSMSVNCLVASPRANGLFNKAIAESGAVIIGGSSMATLQQAEQNGLKTAAALSTLSIDDLRKIPASDLLKVPSVYRPIIDGFVLPQSIAKIFAENKENKVVLLTGWNENEGLMFGPIKTADEFKKQISQQYGNDAATVLKYYPATNDSIAIDSQYDLSRDVIFGVQNYTWANLASKKDENVYVYRFTHRVPGNGEYRKYGAFHTGEVPYALGNLKMSDRPWGKVDYHLADVMSGYWANFIKTGNPNGDRLPEWKTYSSKGKEVMMLGDTQRTEPLKDAAQLDFLYSKMKGD